MSYTICNTCGVQYDAQSVSSCKICDDPRQYIRPEGQTWTTLESLQQSIKYTNKFIPDPHCPSFISVVTTPEFAIGQRACLLLSAKGNILWDCITYIDQATVDYITQLGGLAAIVVSHPHYFSTTCEWAKAFNCPVYLSVEDAEWVTRRTEGVQLWEGNTLELLDGEFVAVKTGGHFPGSSVLLWKSQRKLFVADTIAVVPSGVNHVNRLPGTISFSFMWSYPNLIPLPPDDIYTIWKALEPFDFEDAHGAFMGRDAIGNSRARLLESAKIYVGFSGYANHAIHDEPLI